MDAEHHSPAPPVVLDPDGEPVLGAMRTAKGSGADIVHAEVQARKEQQ